MDILKVRFKNIQDLGSNQSKYMRVKWEKDQMHATSSINYRMRYPGYPVPPSVLSF